MSIFESIASVPTLQNAKKPWTVEEDQILRTLMMNNTNGNWTSIAENLPNRSGKQCRERWHNHLNPGIKKGDWTEEEDRLIVTMQKAIGNQWAKMTKLLPGRTDNAVKNRFHATVRARIRYDKDDDSLTMSDLTPAPLVEGDLAVLGMTNKTEDCSSYEQYDTNHCVIKTEDAYLASGLISPVNMVIGIQDGAEQSFVPYFDKFPSPPLPESGIALQQPIPYACCTSPVSHYASVMTLPLAYPAVQMTGQGNMDIPEGGCGSSGDFVVNSAVMINEDQEYTLGASQHAMSSLPLDVDDPLSLNHPMSFSPVSAMDFAVDEEYLDDWLGYSMDDDAQSSKRHYGLEVQPCCVMPFTFGDCGASIQTMGNSLFTGDFHGDMDYGGSDETSSSGMYQDHESSAGFNVPQMCGLEAWTLGRSICPQPKREGGYRGQVHGLGMCGIGAQSFQPQTDAFQYGDEYEHEHEVDHSYGAYPRYQPSQILPHNYPLGSRNSGSLDERRW